MTPGKHCDTLELLRDKAWEILQVLGSVQKGSDRKVAKCSSMREEGGKNVARGNEDFSYYVKVVTWGLFLQEMGLFLKEQSQIQQKANKTQTIKSCQWI